MISDEIVKTVQRLRHHLAPQGAVRRGVAWYGIPCCVFFLTTGRSASGEGERSRNGFHFPSHASNECIPLDILGVISLAPRNLNKKKLVSTWLRTMNIISVNKNCCRRYLRIIKIIKWCQLKVNKYYILWKQSNAPFNGLSYARWKL